MKEPVFFFHLDVFKSQMNFKKFIFIILKKEYIKAEFIIDD